MPAGSDFVNRVILAPGQDVRLVSKAADPSPLIHYIAANQQLNYTDAEQALQDCCSTITAKLGMGESVTFPGLGTLMQDEKGYYQFVMMPLPDAFERPVPAERVIHPAAEHQVLVGDRETTSTAMADYYAAAPERKQRWWIGALLLFLLGTGVMAYQYIQHPDSGFTGNGLGVTPGIAPLQYQEIK